MVISSQEYSRRRQALLAKCSREALPFFAAPGSDAQRRQRIPLSPEQ